MDQAVDRSGWIMSIALAMKLPLRSVDTDGEITAAVTHRMSQYHAPNNSKSTTQVSNFTDMTVFGHVQLKYGLRPINN